MRCIYICILSASCEQDATLCPHEYRPVPGPRVKFPEQNIPCQQKSIGEDTPQPSPIYEEGLLKENLMILDILPTNRPDPQTPKTRGEGEVVGAEEPGGDPPFELVHNPPSVEVELGQSAEVRLDQSENENTNFPQTMLTFLQLSQGRMEELNSLLSVGGDTTHDGQGHHSRRK